ncbi:hypothetical protein CDAR_574661 [Caerostris darwini]|uniref:Uncharacterized protein n=1 Tax=Caerostris darwini TaxID=1538125 RepID=A0AAV4QI23_9ARAC|nr:hypothetical protein CDAR_574661 [Caerostris darwini]
MEVDPLDIMEPLALEACLRYRRSRQRNTFPNLPISFPALLQKFSSQLRYNLPPPPPTVAMATTDIL